MFGHFKAHRRQRRGVGTSEDSFWGNGFSSHDAWHVQGRGRGGRGHGFGRDFPGGFGGGFGGPSFPGGGPSGFGGGEGLTRGRKFSSDDLQLLLLALLEEQSSYGYELIKALSNRSNGFYSPSPGMVYPALTYLEELGHVTVEVEGNRKRYALSDVGRDYLNENRAQVEMMQAKLTHFAFKMESVRRAFAGEEPLDVSEGGWVAELIKARHAVKSAILRHSNASADEQRRIAAILQRAADEIENGDSNK